MNTLIALIIDAFLIYKLLIEYELVFQNINYLFFTLLKAPVVTADVGRFFKDFYDVNTYTYQTILLMYSLQELQSGRYICRGASKEHDKLAIHYDVFVPGKCKTVKKLLRIYKT